MARLDPLQELGIVRSECDADLHLAHLQGFIDAFVLREYRDRVRALLRRGSWLKVSKAIEQRLDPARCRPFDEHSRPDSWREPFDERGVYVADLKVALEMSVADASKLSSHTTSDALFSIELGRRAVFFNHDWGVWLCEAPR